MEEDKKSLNLEGESSSPEAKVEAVRALASEFHESWRKTRLQEDGSYEPRIKTTKDEEWVKEHGTDQVDIANTTYDGLPSDWQYENKAAADTVVELLSSRGGSVDLSDEVTRNELGSAVHESWLSRNEWAKGGELDVPFAQLSAEEQAKDISQIEVAQELFG